MATEDRRVVRGPSTAAQQIASQATCTHVIAKHQSASREHIVFAVKRLFTLRVKLTCFIYTAQRKVGLPSQHSSLHNITRVITTPDLLSNMSSRSNTTHWVRAHSVSTSSSIRRLNCHDIYLGFWQTSTLRTCNLLSSWRGDQASHGFVISDFHLPKPQAASGLSDCFISTRFSSARALSGQIFLFFSEKVMKTGNPVLLGLWQACLFTSQITCAHFTQACRDDLKQGERLKKKSLKFTMPAFCIFANAVNSGLFFLCQKSLYVPV